MSEKEKKILETIATAVPKMSEFDNSLVLQHSTGKVGMMANVQMTKVQMWNRYKALKKKDYNWTCICPVCSKQIYEKDPDIEYVKTKRGTKIFIHTQCIKEWDK